MHVGHMIRTQVEGSFPELVHAQILLVQEECLCQRNKVAIILGIIFSFFLSCFFFFLGLLL